MELNHEVSALKDLHIKIFDRTLGVIDLLVLDIRKAIGTAVRIMPWIKEIYG